MMRFDLEAPRTVSALAGRVLDWQGTPLAGACVIGELSEPGAGPPALWKSGRGFRRALERVQVRTNGDGVFEFHSLEPPPLSWTVVVDGCSPYSLSASDAADPCEIRMPRPRPLSGRVLAADGSPAVDAWVRLQPTARGATSLDALSDSRGVFEVHGLMPGEFWVSAVEREGRNSVARACVLGEPEWDELELRLGPHNSISGVMESDGTLRAGVRVQLETARADRPLSDVLLHDDRARWTTTDATGRFAFPGLREGPYLMSAFDDEHSLLGVLFVEAPADVRWSVDERALGVVRGYLNGAAEFESLSLVLESPSLSESHVVRVEASGRFEVRRLPPGAYTLIAIRVRGGPEVLMRFELPAGGVLHFDDIRLAPPASLRIVARSRVALDPAGSSCSLEGVESGLVYGEPLARYERGELRFDFEAMPPGEYALIARLREASGLDTRVLRATIALEAGRRSTVKLPEE